MFYRDSEKTRIKEDVNAFFFRDPSLTSAMLIDKIQDRNAQLKLQIANDYSLSKKFENIVRDTDRSIPKFNWPDNIGLITSLSVFQVHQARKIAILSPITFIIAGLNANFFACTYLRPQRRKRNGHQICVTTVIPFL